MPNWMFWLHWGLGPSYRIISILCYDCYAR